MYFLWYFIRKDKTVVYESVHNKRVWVFSPNGCRSFEGIAGTDSCPELFNNETYFLFDAKAGDSCHEPTSSPAFLLLFSSPNDSSYKQTSRDSIVKLGFTSPSYNELLLLGNALNIEEKYIHKKFKKYGPDIRFVIQINDEDANYTINEAIAKFDVDRISSYFDGTYLDAAKKSNYPSVLFKTTVMESEFNTLQDAYRCKNVQWEFASDYIGNRVIDKFKDSSVDFVKKFF
jgi:hypothetical protein